MFLANTWKMYNIFYTIDEDSRLSKCNSQNFGEYLGIRVSSYFRFGVVIVPGNEETIDDYNDSCISLKPFFQTARG